MANKPVVPPDDVIVRRDDLKLLLDIIIDNGMVADVEDEAAVNRLWAAGGFKP